MMASTTAISCLTVSQKPAVIFEQSWYQSQSRNNAPNAVANAAAPTAQFWLQQAAIIRAPAASTMAIAAASNPPQRFSQQRGSHHGQGFPPLPPPVSQGGTITRISVSKHPL